MRLQVTVDERQKRAIAQALAEIPNGAEMALSRAINKVAKPSESLIVKDAAKQTGFTQKVIRKKNVRMSRASWRKLTAEIRVFGRGIPIIMLKARQTRKGVTYKGKGGRKLIPGAFIATMRTGHEGVFKRRASGTRRELRHKSGRALTDNFLIGKGNTYYTELPIDEQRAPGVPQIVTDSGAFAQAQAQAAAKLPTEIATQVKLVIEQHARKAAAKS